MQRSASTGDCLREELALVEVSRGSIRATVLHAYTMRAMNAAQSGQCRMSSGTATMRRQRGGLVKRVQPIIIRVRCCTLLCLAIHCIQVLARRTAAGVCWRGGAGGVQHAVECQRSGGSGAAARAWQQRCRVLSGARARTIRWQQHCIVCWGPQSAGRCHSLRVKRNLQQDPDVGQASCTSVDLLGEPCKRTNQ